MPNVRVSWLFQCVLWKQSLLSTEKVKASTNETESREQLLICQVFHVQTCIYLLRQFTQDDDDLPFEHHRDRRHIQFLGSCKYFLCCWFPHTHTQTRTHIYAPFWFWFTLIALCIFVFYHSHAGRQNNSLNRWNLICDCNGLCQGDSWETHESALNPQDHHFSNLCITIKSILNLSDHPVPWCST